MVRKSMGYIGLIGVSLAILACEAETPGSDPIDDTDGTTVDAGAPDATEAGDAAVGVDATAEPDASGPPRPAVGVTTIQVEGPGGRTLPTSIWYPAPPDTPGDPIVYQGFIPREAIENAPIAEGGPWPLIVFSHGNMGVKEQSVFLMEELARGGYIVAAPDHVGNTFFDPEEAPTAGLLNHLRPLDVSATIDRMTAPEEGDPAWLASGVDGARVGVTGHSRGGYTALAVVGGALGVRADYRAYCGASPDDPICVRFPVDDAPHSFRDDRIIASMPMSPAAYTLTPDSLAEAEAPVLILTGRLDTSTPYVTTVRPLYDALSAPRALWTLVKGNHYTFSDLCQVYDLLGELVQDRFGDACAPDNPLQAEDAHPQIQAVALAFFDHALKGIADTEGLLAPAAGDDLVILNDGLGQ